MARWFAPSSDASTAPEPAAHALPRARKSTTCDGEREHTSDDVLRDPLNQGASKGELLVALRLVLGGLEREWPADEIVEQVERAWAPTAELITEDGA